MSGRPSRPGPALVLQDELLCAEREEKGVVEADGLPVNAANSALLGRFCPCHGSIDNAIHSAAGLQLREELAACCRSCLELAAGHGLERVAFCCISTGEFHFPSQEAAEIAVKTVTELLTRDTSIRKVIFNVFKDLDAEIYRDLLGPDRTAEAGA